MPERITVAMVYSILVSFKDYTEKRLEKIERQLEEMNHRIDENRFALTKKVDVNAHSMTHAELEKRMNVLERAKWALSGIGGAVWVIAASILSSVLTAIIIKSMGL